MDQVAAGMRCLQHPDKQLELYCEQCRTPVCVSCKEFIHSEHATSNIGEAAQNAVTALTRLTYKWIEAVDHAKALSDVQKNISEELNEEHFERKIDEINKTFVDFKKKVEDDLETMRIDAITEFMLQFYFATCKTQETYETVERAQKEMMNTLENARELVQRMNPVEIMQQYQGMKATLRSLDFNNLQIHAEKFVFKTKAPELSLCFDNLIIRELQMMDTNVTQHNLAFEQRVQLTNPVSIFTSWKSGERRCCGLAFHDEEFVVTNFDTRCVRIFSHNEFKRNLKFQRGRFRLQKPFDVTFNNDGEIFITDLGIKGIVRYDAQGFLMKICPNVYKNVGYVTCHGDRLVVSDTDRGRVIITDFDCKIQQQLDGLTLGLGKFEPRYVCMNNRGQLVVTEWNPGRVRLIDPTRETVVSTLTHPLSNIPRGVCIDSHGHILVADDLNNQVIHYNDERANVIVPRCGLRCPTALCLPAPGYVSVVERFTGEVITFRYL